MCVTNMRQWEGRRMKGMHRHLFFSHSLIAMWQQKQTNKKKQTKPHAAVERICLWSQFHSLSSFFALLFFFAVVSDDCSFVLLEAEG